MDAALEAAGDLSAAINERPLAVNADLHSDQVLKATREPWLAVDSLLYSGDIEYDLARCLWTRLDEMTDDHEITRHFRNLVQSMQGDEERARSWASLRTVDYWLWGLDAGLTEDPPRCERLLTALGS